MCLRARSRSVFTSVKNGFDFAFFLATEVTPEGRDSAPVFIHRRAGVSENNSIRLRQIWSRAAVSNSPTLGSGSGPVILNGWLALAREREKNQGTKAGVP